LLKHPVKYTYGTRMTHLWYTSTIFFLDFVHRLMFDEARRFGSQLCFRLQARKAPTLVDP